MDEIIRVRCYMRFKHKDDWSNLEAAILDTGAYISLLPKHLWEFAAYKVIGEDRLRGVVPKEGCELPVNIAVVTAVMEDMCGNVSEEIDFRAYLVNSNDVPLIIGFKDLLEHFDIHLNIKNNDGHIEM